MLGREHLPPSAALRRACRPSARSPRAGPSPQATASARGETELAARSASKATDAFPARLSRNTPCSPNVVQNHHGPSAVTVSAEVAQLLNSLSLSGDNGH